jgi:hypothetical protein
MNPQSVGYRHTQRAPLYLLMLAGALVFGVMVVFLKMPPVTRIAPSVAIVVFVFCAFCFMHLTVQDEGTHLGVRFGPLPLFRKRIPYTEMTSVQRSRSKVIDGWGVHCIVGRGWTWNIWGFDCAEIKLGERTIRVGSDEADALVKFLEAKITSRR